MDSENRGAKLFSFAVVADTHLNQSDIECNSPFDVNRRANRRLRYVIDDINSRDIDKVFHLGDVVHPVPSMGNLYAESASRFFEQTAALRPSLHLIPGNHDVGDKKIAWGPAGTIRDEFLEAWSEYFGDHYFHLHDKGVHFIGLNIQLLGSGLGMEQQQRDWFERTLNDISGERIFFCTHYPPFLCSVSEPEHYDNLSVPQREWLLGLLDMHNVEALFAGHVHHFWFNRYREVNCYLLPSTAFTRQDYSEMFRIDSGEEFGRNDTEKLGYLVVHVHERGHRVEMIRSSGLERDSEDIRVENSQLIVNDNKSRMPPGIGFDLRHDWCEVVQIPPSGGLDEFDRKSVRNDYALLALMEMNVKYLRLPIGDLLDDAHRQRLIDIRQFGFEYTFFSFGAPDWAVLEILRAEPSLVSSWELTIPVDDIDSLDRKFLELARELNIALYLSPLRSKHDIVSSGKKYYHVINHGLTADDKSLSEQILSSPLVQRYFSGVVFRNSINDNIQHAVEYAHKTHQANGLRTSIHLRLAGDNPAENVADQRTQLNRLAEASLLSGAVDNIRIFCDTFSDNDRGYFPRSGVVDRLYNPKPGMRLVKYLGELLDDNSVSRESVVSTDDDLRTIDISSKVRQQRLCLFDKDDVPLNRVYEKLSGDKGDWQFVDLDSGRVHPVSKLHKIRSISLESRLPLLLLRKS